MEERKPYKQAGIESIIIHGDGKDFEVTACPLNYGYIVLYQPEKNKLITWDLGMEKIFWGNRDGSVSYVLSIDFWRFN